MLHRQAITWLQANFAASWLLEGETQPLARGLCSYIDALAIWEVLDFQHLPRVQTPSYCQLVSFAAVLTELLPWAKETLHGTSLFGIPTCAQTDLENFWRSYKAAVDISSEPCALYLNVSTPKFASLLCLQPQSMSQWRALLEARQLLFDVALIFIAARLLGQPVLMVLPMAAWPLVCCLDKIPEVNASRDGAVVFHCGIDIEAFSPFCFTP